MIATNRVLLLLVIQGNPLSDKVVMRINTVAYGTLG